MFVYFDAEPSIVVFSQVTRQKGLTPKKRKEKKRGHTTTMRVIFHLDVLSGVDLEVPTRSGAVAVAEKWQLGSMVQHSPGTQPRTPNPHHLSSSQFLNIRAGY
jgi:hypothetical protein